MERLCFVEDDPTIQELVAEKLRRAGYGVDVFDNAEAVLERESEWDLYVFDILLSGDKTGLDLCREMRRRYPRAPILMLTALSDPSSRIEGLQLGADDYLTKPFEMRELLLRVSGMFRRRSWYQILPKNSTEFEWDGNQIDFRKFEARTLSGVHSLSEKETMLMKLFVENANQVVTRDEILDRVWGYNVFPSSRTVDNFVLRLRKIFEPSPNLPRYIHTIRGVGYRFTPEGE